MLPKGDHEKLVALQAAVDKGDAVSRVEAHAPGAPTPPPVTPETTTGNATKVEKDRITVKADDGTETAYAVSANPAGEPIDAVVTIDGVSDKLENIRPNSRVTIARATTPIRSW